MPTSEVSFYTSISPGLVVFAGDFFLPKLIISWTDLRSWKKTLCHILTSRGTQNIPHQPQAGKLKSCVKLTDPLSVDLIDKRDCIWLIAVIYIYGFDLSISGLSPFYFIIFPLLETEEQKSIAWVLASHWKIKGHAFQFQLRKHSGWAEAIHQTPVG